jgi:hypothetical protein
VPSFELVGVSQGEDLQLIQESLRNVIWVVRHANVVDRLLRRASVRVLEQPAMRPARHEARYRLDVMGGSTASRQGGSP